MNALDMYTPELLAEPDAKMISEMTVSNYFQIYLSDCRWKGLR